ncbi:YebC/PmpR family DNA-binding transcriptional regulator [Blattabacterium cuenoti]|uniref:YebC/PmpR family DNA-binding transcriptional regulator n=1 Tax=Blattabacterium cuenoti TaxID=1653831 RepID=UPI00163C3495|nr:YebC/PmpR family DNA-binding transcriptional regulator [Blattabacterium cuenoti]
MSGHSKWTNIQHRKQNQDIKKSKKFSKFIREINLIIKKFGINSFHLKKIIDNAKLLNIPKNKIEKIIKKSLIKNNNNCKNLDLEGKIHGICIYIECITDNNIRTTSNIRTCFNKHGGKLCNNGNLSHFFSKKMIFSIKKEDIFSIKDFELMLIDFGANDIFNKNNKIDFITNFEDFGTMKNNLEKLKLKYNFKSIRIPNHLIDIKKENKEKVINLIEKLKKFNDIKNIYSNLII